MLLVNLFGQPGAGKSTGAAYIFSRLKMLGYNCELVTEFAKDKVYEENKGVFQNQLYILGKQWFRTSRVEDKVDIVITDSPVLLSVFYNRLHPNKYLGTHFEDIVRDIHKGYDSLNFFINRVKPYNPSGRFQTEDESDAIAKVMIEFLNEWDVKYAMAAGDVHGYDAIVDKIINTMGAK